MKKIISVLATLLLAVCLLATGCSCSGNETLYFSIDTTKAETCKYSVKFENDYHGNYKKTVETSSAFNYKYDENNATFVTKLSLVTELPDNIKDNDIVNLGTMNKTVYKFTTEFSIPLTITIKDTDYTHTERIETTAYIASSGVSLAPIYTEERAEYYAIAVSKQTDPIVKVLKTETETLYGMEEFTTTKKSKEFELDEEITVTPDESFNTAETTGKYTFRSAIDNAELLLALRAVQVESSAPINLPVISPSYNKPTALKITNEGSSTYEFEINGEKADKKYDTLSFRVSNSNTAGTNQYVKVQSADSKSGNSLLLEYAKPLVCVYNGSYASMGWLIFTLSEIA